ncbi:MAG: hypothetical protein KC620_09050, partial [Myxococcales bacterium]|nr:hypothetical protein [Myxococcales bacterium]
MRRLPWLAGLAAMWACSIDHGEVRDRIAADATPASWDDAGTPFTPPTDDGSPRLTIESIAEAEDGFARLVGTASDDRAVVAMSAMVGRSGPYLIAEGPAGYGSWTVDVPILPAGPVEVAVTAYDGGGRTAVERATLERPAPPDSQGPEVLIDEPADGFETNAPEIFLRGRTTDDYGVVEVRIGARIEGQVIPLAPAATADHFGHWTARVPLPAAQTTTLVAQAYDAAGNAGSARIDVTSRAAPAHGPPRIVRIEPGDGSTVDRAHLPVRVVVESDVDLDVVMLAVGNGPAQPITPSGGNYTHTVVLRPGPNRLRAIARDVDGLMAREIYSLTLDDGWGDGPTMPIGLPSPPGTDAVLDLDKTGVTEMFPADVQRDTVLMLLDPDAMVRNSLAAIRVACGANWNAPDFVPVCPPDWGAAEINLYRLLTMTPNNANVAGTRLESAATLSEPFLGLPFARILADSMQVDLNQGVLADDPLVAALIENLIGSHPNVSHAADGSPRLAVTLLDGLLDMAPLAERFGPAGDHPGFIAGPLSASVLTDQFRMGLTLRSNLQVYEGVDLRRARKDYFADRPPDVPVVELAFLDLDRFSLTGIDPAPAVSLDFGMFEADTAATPGWAPEPVGQGNSNVWDFPRWTLERVVAEATRNAFGGLRVGCDLCSGAGSGALLYSNPESGADLAEIAIGRLGYDCPAGGPCFNEDVVTPPGVAEHFRSMDQYDCERQLDCARFGPDFECHRQGRCLETAAIDCDRDRNCPLGEVCLLGACLPAGEVECRTDAECGGEQVCRFGHCQPVPTAWFRLWMPPGAAELPPPMYLWDLVLEVAQARLRDGGVPEGEGDAIFHLEGISVGLTDSDIEGFVRDQLATQADTLAERLLGSYAEQNGRVDLFVDTFAGAPWLMLAP